MRKRVLYPDICKTSIINQQKTTFSSWSRLISGLRNPPKQHPSFPLDNIKVDDTRVLWEESLALAEVYTLSG